MGTNLFLYINLIKTIDYQLFFWYDLGNNRGGYKMKKINRKRLNNKGFTLVELLAVVVILALVMGIAASSMLSTMNSSRKSTLHSAAQTAATNLNNWVGEDAIVTVAADKKLGNTFIEKSQTGDWICLGNADIAEIDNADGNEGLTADLVTALGLNETDIKIDAGGTFAKEVITAGSEADPTCSALRYNKNSGGYEIVLVAEDDGKYYVAGDTFHYAYSRATGPNTQIAD